MVNLQRNSGGLFTDNTPVSSSSPLPSISPNNNNSVDTTPQEQQQQQQSSRRRTIHILQGAGQDNTSDNTPANVVDPQQRPPTGRRKSNPNNVPLKFPRFASRATAKRLFQQIVSSSSFSTSQPVDIRPSPPSPPASSAASPPRNSPTSTSTTSTTHRSTTTAATATNNTNTPASAANTGRMSPPTMVALGGGNTGRVVAIGGGNTGIPSHQHALFSQSPRSSGTSLATRHGRSGSVGSTMSCPGEKPLASTSGGQVTLDIRLAEPYLFLQGYDSHHQQTVGGPALLRGTLVVKVAKAAKFKSITLTFKGRARTDWPEGIPPSKTAFYEEKEIMTHHWPFFNAQFAVAETTHGADATRLLAPEPDHRATPSLSGAPGAIGSLARTSSPIGISAASSTLANAALANAGLGNDKRLSLQLNQRGSFGRSESPGRSVASRGYKLFQPGEYSYNFELPIENILPETIQCDLGTVKYELEATIERAGAFRPNLVGKKDVVLIRCPADSSLEQVEPIAISRNWEDQLHYDIVISGKSFPMGSQIPIAFKLTPLAKVRCHRIKIFVTENIEYFCRNKKVHRIEPTRKIQIYEKRADGTVHGSYPGSSARVTAGGRRGDPDNPDSALGPDQRLGDNLLGDLEGDIIGPTEMEFNVRLPGCGAKEGKIHFDTTYKNIQVHHWIKIVMRLSKVDPNDPSKRRHFEISIDSPFHILSCKCSHANISLPAYSDRDNSQQPTNSCNCPGSGRNTPLPFGNVEAALPDTAPDSTARPMHLLRAPSFNPPAFDDDIAPPPLATPPPHYDTVGGGLADYFARLADQTAEDDDTEDDSPSGDLAVTSPTRLARSLDERRTWVPAT